MHRFNIMRGNKDYSLDIENIKLLFGKNELVKNDIYYILKNHFAKSPLSDYAIEDNQRRKVLFDGDLLDTKTWKFIDINPFFDIEADFKLGSKSLVTKYLSSISDSLEQNDTFRTLSILIDSLNNDFFENETKIEFGDKLFQIKIGEISRAVLLKEAVPFLECFDNECNYADMSYEDVILLQLSLLAKIVENDRDKKYIAFCTIPIFTSKIRLAIYGLKYENLFAIISSQERIDMDIKDVCSCGKSYIDFANEDMILERIMDLPFHIEKESFIQKASDAYHSSEIDIKDTFNFEIFY